MNFVALALLTIGLSFHPNKGQAPKAVQFLARGDGYNLQLTAGGSRLVVRGESIQTRLLGARPNARVKGEDPLPGKVNYLRGKDSITDIATYGRVRYSNVYPGIDLVYYGKESRLEYDFIVKPGANPNSIVLGFDDDVILDSSGNLVLRTGASEFIQRKPVIFQGGQEIPGHYRLLSSRSAGFEIAAYDHTAPLTIDPVLTYSTYLGGSDGNDDARAIAMDSSGNVYVAGSTTSTNFPTLSPIQGSAGADDPGLEFSDAFITKLNAAGTALVYSTYLGGSSDDDAVALAVDASGSVVIAGTTNSTDFRTTAGAFRRTCNTASDGTCQDAFVARLSASGASLMFSTYLGGTDDDEARDVALDGAGGVYVAGQTLSLAFPTTSGVYSSDPGLRGFVTKLSPAGAIVYSTYFGVGGTATEVRGIAVDAAGSAYITGNTSALAAAATGSDVFVSKLNSSGTSATFTSYIRGAKEDIGNDIALDSSGNIYVTGQTSSVDFQTTAGVAQPLLSGNPLFRSANAGTTWSNGSGITAASLYALAAVPGTAGALYAGADDELSGGLFKSTNSGVTWNVSNSGLSDTRIHALAVDPATPSTVYAGTRQGGLFKSTNSGATWSPTSLGNVFVTAIAIDPLTPSTLYAATAANGMYKSTNAGGSWAPINNGLASSGINTLAINPATPNIAYAGTSGGIYKTTDGGGTWVAANQGLFDPNVNVLIVDPRNPNLLYAATNSVGIFRSVNGGSFWLASNGGLTSSSVGILVSALTIDPASGTLYAAIGESNVSSVYKSSNGITWTPTGLSTTRITSLAVENSNSNAVYAAAVGGADAFAAKWNAAGNLTYSTFLGGFRDDAGTALAVDSGGNVYVAGNTSSTNFPTLNALQPAFAGGSDLVTDAFVTKLNPAATAIIYSTFLGGTSNDFARGIAVDAAGDAYVAGVTASGDFPTASALFSRPGLQDAFIARISDTNTVSYFISGRAGISRTSQGVPASATVGYARVQPTGGNATPEGLAIFGFRQGNVLVSEAAVPASRLISSGRIYAEVAGPVNTGIAIANPNSQDVTVTFYFTDANGQNFGTGSTTIGANSQTAKFLDQAPFNSGTGVTGTFTFNASAPVSVIALRGLTNERSEFLITTLPVSDLSVPPTSETIVFPHFADGGGWTTQIVMVNSTDAEMTGSIQFYSPGTVTTPGQPASVTIAGQSANTFSYSIPARSSRALRTAGLGTTTQVGSVRMIPSGTSRTPTGLGIFNFRNVSEAGVPALRSGNAFRLYAESAGNFNATAIGSIQTGIAIANASATPATVTFELTTLTGTSTGMTGTVTVPANGQIAMFLGQIQGFTTLSGSFQGILRVSTASSSGVSVVGLRGRYNERHDFLITTTAPTNESTPPSTSELFFPHLADGGGYTTQFILYNGSASQSLSGSLKFFTQAGQTYSLAVR